MKTRTAMILAAGYGKRLHPLTNKIPKPLIEINNKSLLGHTIDMLLSCGIEKFIINTHYKAKLIKDYLLKNYNDSHITILYEHTLLDTGGGVKNAKNYFKENHALIINSDIFWNKLNYQDIKNLLAYKNKEKCCLLLSKINSSYAGRCKISLIGSPIRLIIYIVYIFYPIRILEKLVH